MEDLQKNKADCVIGADQKSLNKERQVKSYDSKLKSSGKDGEDATSGSRPPHLPIVAPGAGNVMITTMAGPLHGLASQKGKVLAKEQRDPGIVQPPANQRVQQGAGGYARLLRRERVLARGECVREQFHPLQGRLDTLQIIDEGGTDSGILHLQMDVV